MVASRTYLSTSTGWKLTKPPNTELPYITDPDPGPGGSRFFGDPGEGNMYLGVSNLDDNPTRESYFTVPVGLYRHYWNTGIVEAQNGSGYQAAITRIGADIDLGRVPWPSFKLKSSGPTKTADATWTQAANGAADARINTILSGINTAVQGKGPVFITWHHEPNSSDDIAANGTPADYKAMCTHMQTLMAPYPNLVQVGGVLSAGYYQMTGGGGWNMRDWVSSASCDIFGLDIYNPWSPTGKTFQTVDNALRLGGIAECLAIDPDKPIAIGELGVRTYTATPGRSAQWLQDAYDYALSANVVGIAYFDSGANSPAGPWTLDRNYLNALESPAERLIKYKALSLSATSKRIPLGGASS